MLPSLCRSRYKKTKKPRKKMGSPSPDRTRTRVSGRRASELRSRPRPYL